MNAEQIKSINDIPTIRTTEELRGVMVAISGEVVTDDRLIWFVCYQNARLVINCYTTKDIASMFESGMEAAKFEDVQNFIDTYFEEEDNEGYQVATVFWSKASPNSMDTMNW